MEPRETFYRSQREDLTRDANPSSPRIQKSRRGPGRTDHWARSVGFTTHDSYLTQGGCQLQSCQTSNDFLCLSSRLLSPGLGFHPWATGRISPGTQKKLRPMENTNDLCDESAGTNPFTTTQSDRRIRVVREEYLIEDHGTRNCFHCALIINI